MKLNSFISFENRKSISFGKTDEISNKCRTGKYCVNDTEAGEANFMLLTVQPNNLSVEGIRKK